MNLPVPKNWQDFETIVRDAQAQRWKSRAFSGKPDNPGATGALVKMEDVPSGMGGVIIYFSCQDCAVECARVPKNGGTIMKDKFSIGQYGYIALPIPRLTQSVCTP